MNFHVCLAVSPTNKIVNADNAASENSFFHAWGEGICKNKGGVPNFPHKRSPARKPTTMERTCPTCHEIHPLVVLTPCRHGVCGQCLEAVELAATGDWGPDRGASTSCPICLEKVVAVAAPAPGSAAADDDAESMPDRLKEVPALVRTLEERMDIVKVLRDDLLRGAAEAVETATEVLAKIARKRLSCATKGVKEHTELCLKGLDAQLEGFDVRVHQLTAAAAAAAANTADGQAASYLSMLLVDETPFEEMCASVFVPKSVAVKRARTCNAEDDDEGCVEVLVACTRASQARAEANAIAREIREFEAAKLCQLRKAGLDNALFEEEMGCLAARASPPPTVCDDPVAARLLAIIEGSARLPPDVVITFLDAAETWCWTLLPKAPAVAHLVDEGLRCISNLAVGGGLGREDEELGGQAFLGWCRFVTTLLAREHLQSMDRLLLVFRLLAGIKHCTSQVSLHALLLLRKLSTYGPFRRLVLLEEGSYTVVGDTAAAGDIEFTAKAFKAAVAVLVGVMGMLRSTAHIVPCHQNRMEASEAFLDVFTTVLRLDTFVAEGCVDRYDEPGDDWLYVKEAELLVYVMDTFSPYALDGILRVVCVEPSPCSLVKRLLLMDSDRDLFLGDGPARALIRVMELEDHVTLGRTERGAYGHKPVCAHVRSWLEARFEGRFEETEGFLGAWSTVAPDHLTPVAVRLLVLVLTSDETVEDHEDARALFLGGEMSDTKEFGAYWLPKVCGARK